MSSFSNKVIIALLVMAVVSVIAMKGRGTAPKEPEATPVAAVPEAKATAQPQQAPEAAVAAKLPMLMDLGANKCIPCKAMKPILDELKTSYAGTIEVVFVDVWENPAKGKEYRVEIIPTQIFFDAAGKELFRHQGFYGREDILAKWKELGIDTGAGAK